MDEEHITTWTDLVNNDVEIVGLPHGQGIRRSTHPAQRGFGVADAQPWRPNTKNAGDMLMSALQLHMHL